MDSSRDILKIAVMAVGGQGGGVLTSWIAELASQAGYAVQMTSVAGVAQRTGATIYYVEVCKNAQDKPVFALSPSPGDIDILIASELMEAGRAILRGFVSEDKTTLIASTHRVLAISEKQQPGDGRAESDVVLKRFAQSALKSVCFDMQAIADHHGSMISASLFGALAKSQALPFGSEQFESVIRDSGRGVETSLAAFRAALNYSPTQSSAAQKNTAVNAANVTGPARLMKQWQALVSRVQQMPAAAQPMVMAGLKKVVDYQDVAYGDQYLNQLSRFADVDTTGDRSSLLNAAAKYLANAMCYDDIIRVADLKTRRSRDSRVRDEQKIGNEKTVKVTEYFHPRAEELCATLPASIGAWIESSPRIFSIVQRLLGRGRRVRSDGMTGFTLLWLIAGMRRYRRRLLRHRYETEHLKTLIDCALRAAPGHAPLAVEILQCQRLIKGYSDTHARGRSKFQRVLQGSSLVDPDKRVTWLRDLRDAALQDEHGEQLDALLATAANH